MKDSPGQASCLRELQCCWKAWLTAGAWKHAKALEWLESYFIISLCRRRHPPAGQGASVGCCVGTRSLRVQRGAEVGQGAETGVSLLFLAVYSFLFLIFKGAQAMHGLLQHMTFFSPKNSMSNCFFGCLNIGFQHHFKWPGISLLTYKCFFQQDTGVLQVLYDD